MWTELREDTLRFVFVNIELRVVILLERILRYRYEAGRRVAGEKQRGSSKY